MERNERWRATVYGGAALVGALLMYNGLKKRPEKQGPLVFVGCYTEKLGHILGDKLGRGIYPFRLGSDGSLTPIGDPFPIRSPSFLRTSPDGCYLYATSEVKDFLGGGSLSVFEVDRSSGSLRKIQKIATTGAESCYVDVNEEMVVCANYSGSSVALFRIEAGGRLTRSDVIQFPGPTGGFGPDRSRQESSHPHQCVLQGENSLLVCDLGTDCVHRLRAVNGRFQWQSDTFMKPGCGPRHLAIHPNRLYVYVINELDNTIGVYTISNGVLNSHLQTISTLPEGWTGVQSDCKSLSKNHCADIHISPNGQFLYGSNRGHDSIAIFKVNLMTGTLSPRGHQSIDGSIPRNFAITPDGRYMLIACQDTHTINTFRINEKTGELTNTGLKAIVPSPVCIEFCN